MGKEAKTNAMRILEREKVPYTAHEYAHEEGVAVAGVDVAGSMGEDPACVYKTLVTQGSSKNYFVFVIPVAAELDLKAAARSVGEKSVAMIHVADINKVTGYVRGGCSPVGMKKQYKTVFDESVLAQEKVYVSGGRIGTQVARLWPRPSLTTPSLWPAWPWTRPAWAFMRTRSTRTRARPA